MRSIGKRNIELVKTYTREELAKVSDTNVSQKVYERIPQSVFDIWESSYQEIDRIIYDEVVRLNPGRLKAGRLI